MQNSCCLLLLIFVALVQSQPANNLCSSATQISSFPYTYTGTTVGSTKEHSCNDEEDAGDVWFTFTPTTSIDLMKISTCATGANSFDTYIYLASGSCDSYSCLQSDDQGCILYDLSVMLATNIQAGVTYFIMVSGWSGDTGRYILTVEPVSSNCANAQTVAALPFSITGSLSNTEYHASPCRTNYADWYAFTTPATIIVRASVCNEATFDTMIYLVSGSCPDTLTCVNFNNNAAGCGSGTSQLDITLTANQPYYFVVTSLYSDVTGSYTLTILENNSANDQCATATAITTLPYSVIGSTSAATQDYTCTSGGSTVTSSGADLWYSFTPSANYPAIVLSACESDVRTALYLSSGSCGGRQCIQSDSSSCVNSRTQSGRLQTAMQAGTTYYIAAAAATASTGYLKLDMGIPPVNDQCAGAVQIHSLPFTFTGSTTLATWDYTCPLDPEQARDIYFQISPAVDYSDVEISLCGSGYDTMLYLASGSCADLSCLAANDDDHDSCGDYSNKSFLRASVLTAGTTYYIIVSGWCSLSTRICYHGDVSLSVTGTAPQSCAQPQLVNSIPFSFEGETTATSGGTFSCTANGDVPVSSVTGTYWFKFTPSQTYNHVFISTCPASFNSALFLATGSCGSLQCSPVSSSGSEYCAALGSTGALISDVSLLAGVEYFIVVTGFSASDFGSFSLTISLDSSASLTILSPAANSVVGGASLSNLLISGKAGSLDARGTVTLTITDSTNATPDITASAVVDFASDWTASVNVLGLVDGLIVVNGALLDLSGNVATTSIRFTKDTSTFVFVSVPIPGSMLSSVTASSVVVAGTGDVGGSVVVTLMDGDSSTPNVLSGSAVVGVGGTWSVTVNIAGLRDGVIRITASIRDSVGNSAESPTVTVSKDTTTVVSIVAPTSFQFVISQARSTSVTISGFGDAGTSVAVQISDEDRNTADLTSTSVLVSPVGTWSMVVDVSHLSDGNIFFVATGRDSANNVAQSQTITLKKDAQVSATVITPANGARVSGSQVTALVISGSGEAGARVSLRITGTTGVLSRTVLVGVGGSWTTTLSIASLPNGTVTIGGTATDGAGNNASISPVSFIKAQ